MVAVVEGSDIILSDVYLSGQFPPCRDGGVGGGEGGRKICIPSLKELVTLQRSLSSEIIANGAN